MVSKVHTLALLLGLALAGIGSPLAYACDEMCPTGEYYSDPAELCVPEKPPES